MRQYLKGFLFFAVIFFSIYILKIYSKKFILFCFIAVLGEVQNGRINSSSQTTFGDDSEPRVHIILQGMNGGAEAGAHTELDYPPPSYEEAISMPSQSPSRNQKHTSTAKTRNATEGALTEAVEEVEEEEEASSSLSTTATNSSATAAATTTTTATSTEAQLLPPNLSHSLFDS